MSLFESTRAREAADPFAYVETAVDERGEHHVIDAGPVIRTDPRWLHDHYPDMLHGDEIWLDSAGEYRYRPSKDRRLQQLAGAFTAYERIAP